MKLFWLSRAVVLVVGLGGGAVLLLVTVIAMRSALDDVAREHLGEIGQRAQQRFSHALTEQGGWDRLTDFRDQLREEAVAFARGPQVRDVLILDARGGVVVSLDEARQEELRLLGEQMGLLTGLASVELRPPIAGRNHDHLAVIGVPLEHEGVLHGGVVLLYDRSAELKALHRAELKIAFGLVAVLVLMNAMTVTLALFVDRRRISGLRRLSKSQREQALQGFARLLAEGVRNPLNGLSLAVQLQQRLTADAAVGDALKAELESNFRVIASELKRISGILDSFVRYADPLSLECRDQVDLIQVVTDSLAAFRPELKQRSIDLQTRLATLLQGRLDPERIRQVVDIIVRNAIDAMPQGGVLRVEAERDGHSARLTIQDSGHGIAPAEMELVFQPYFSTKINGLGLGLAISRRIVEAHGGTITAASRVGEGSTFVIRLPLECVPERRVSRVATGGG